MVLSPDSVSAWLFLAPPPPPLHRASKHCPRGVVWPPPHSPFIEMMGGQALFEHVLIPRKASERQRPDYKLHSLADRVSNNRSQLLCNPLGFWLDFTGRKNINRPTNEAME